MNTANEVLFRERIKEMGQRIDSLERALKLTAVINSTLELAPLLDIITQVAIELTDTASASIMLIDKDTGELRFKAVTGQNSADIKPFAVPLEGSIAGVVATENRPLLILDAQNDPRWYQRVDEQSGFTTRSIIAVPMQIHGQVIGVLEAVNKSDDQQPTWEDVRVLTTLANQAAIAVENAELVEELQAAYDELNQLDQLKSNFIAIAAHELRTPLSVILGYATFLRNDSAGVAKEQADIVLESALRLRSLIDEMVNLREVDLGQAVLDLEVFTLQDLVAGTVEEVHTIVDAKEQQLLLSVPEKPVLIEADRKKMNIVLANLLSNAVKFTANGGRVGIQIGTQGSSVWFRVWDTGIGIPDGQIDRLFDRFYQVESSLTRRYEGLGLGLSIAKEMVDLHNGRIDVQSCVGKGSAFTVFVPVSQNSAKHTGPGLR